MDDNRVNTLMREARKKPSLCQEEERKLLKKYQKTGDEKAFERLVESHMKIVIAIARKYAGYKMSMIDIIQEGNIGLINAVNKYDLSKNNRLAVYAAWHIKAQIMEFILKNWSTVKMPMSTIQKKLFFKAGTYKEIKLERFNRKAVEKLLGCDYNHDIELRCVHATSHDVSLDARRTIHGIDMCLKDNLIDQASQANPETEMLDRERNTIVKQAIATTPDITARERDVVTEKYLHKEHGELKTKEVAKRLGITRQRVEFLEEKSFVVLRKNSKLKEAAA